MTLRPILSGGLPFFVYIIRLVSRSSLYKQKAGSLAVIVHKYLKPRTLRPDLSVSLPFSTFWNFSYLNHLSLITTNTIDLVVIIV